MSKHGKGNFFFGSVKVGERGQIVIPAEARKVFEINPGDKMLVFGHIKKGLGLIKGSRLKNFATKLFQAFEMGNDKENGEVDDEQA